VINSIQLHNFRNFSDRKISFCEWKNIIIWKNGKGKSNILEAICLPISPLVESDHKVLLKRDSDVFFIWYDLPSKSISFSYDGEVNKKKYLVEKKPTTKQKFSHSYPHIISFHPMKMNLLYLGPSHRRDFLDEILIQAFPEYKKILAWFKKVLTHRNKLLKNISIWKSEISEIDFWDTKYIAWTLAIYWYRKKIIDYIKSHISQLSSCFFWKVWAVDFLYASKLWLDITQGDLENKIKEYKEKEIILGKTLFWPHVDDFEITIDSLPLIHYASRWEVKSSLLSFIFIATDFLLQNSEKKEIIFIIDDILAELDSEHRDVLWEYIWEKQCIITAIEDFDIEGKKIFL